MQNKLIFLALQLDIMKLKKGIILLLLLIPATIFAQKAKVWNKPLYDSYRYHFGFAFSLGVLDFSVDHSDDFNNLDVMDSVYSVVGHAKPIFGASIVGNLKLNNNFDLRFIPGLSFGQRDLQYLVKGEGVDFMYVNRVIESTFLQFPLLVKYRAVRENNYRPYLIAGVNYTIDLATRKKIKVPAIEPDFFPKTKLNKHDILIEAGFGIDYYLPYFKFTTELKFSYGLMNIVNYDDSEYSQVFDRLGTKMVTLSIFFE